VLLIYHPRSEGAAGPRLLIRRTKVRLFRSWPLYSRGRSLSATWDAGGSRQLCSGNLQPVPPTEGYGTEVMLDHDSSFQRLAPKTGKVRFSTVAKRNKCNK